jgi:phosphonate transport system substrate-binding protein
VNRSRQLLTSLETKALTRRTALAQLTLATAGVIAMGNQAAIVRAQDGTPAAQASTGPIAAFKIGLIPSESSEEMLENYKPLTDFLKSELEIDQMDVFVGTDYSGVIEAMRGGNLDAAIFGPFSYVLASQVAGAKSLVSPGNDAGEPSTYNSIIIAGANSGIKTLEDLKGHTFAFVDPASTSGHLVPRGMLLQAGINPDTDLEATFSGGHDATALAVNNGQIDAGAMAKSNYDRYLESGTIQEENFVIVATSDPIPEGPLAVSKDFDPAVAERLKQAMLRFHEVETDPAVLEIVIENGTRFVDAPDEIYDGLRALAEELQLTPEDL